MQVCRIEQDLAIYQRKVDAEVAHDAEIEEIAAELIQPGEKCDPLEVSNFDEAISEKLSDSGYALAESLIGFIQSGDGAGLAKKLTDTAAEYWKARALEDFAEDELKARIEQAKEDEAADLWADRQEVMAGY